MAVEKKHRSLLVEPKFSKRQLFISSKLTWTLFIINENHDYFHLHESPLLRFEEKTKTAYLARILSHF